RGYAHDTRSVFNIPLSRLFGMCAAFKKRPRRRPGQEPWENLGEAPNLPDSRVAGRQCFSELAPLRAPFSVSGVRFTLQGLLEVGSAQTIPLFNQCRVPPGLM